MQLDRVSEILGTLGHSTRLAILRTLAPYSRGEHPHGLPAGEIDRRLGIPPATASFHLKEMTAKGLLRQERDGRSIRYMIDVAALLQALDFLVGDICSASS
jgi:DNA-binding transcriptional ArsR family regulator